MVKFKKQEIIEVSFEKNVKLYFMTQAFYLHLEKRPVSFKKLF